jgi:uncharacterized protein involved in exopolysaccharide biosynthesis/LysM repeat protein
MDIIQFLKLIKRNIIVIVMVPAILGSLVWYSTRNEVKKYSSSTTIYTGIGSGLSLESQSSSRLDFFGSKMEFDNIINIFKARKTHEEIALRLLAQGLILKTWDPQYISRRSYIKLHKKAPQYIKDLVVKPSDDSAAEKIAKAPMVLNDTTVLSKTKLFVSDEVHQIKYGETLFTLSEKFNTPVSNLMSWNNLTSTDLIPNSKLIVKKHQKVVGYNMDGLRDTINLFIPDTNFFIRANIDSTAFEKTVQALKDYANQNDTNYIYKLLNFGHPHYSIKAISKVKPKRVQGSDLVSISFTSDDPGICKQTLLFTIYAFELNYRKLKENQSDHIIKYFEKRVKESSAQLQAAENRLLKFNQDNNIINYYEQTRHISDQKEQLDSRYYDEKMAYAAADSTINTLEKQLEERVGVAKLNTQVLGYRNELSNITYKIAINELNDSGDPKTVNALKDLRQDAEDLKAKIKAGVNDLYNLQYSPEGVNSKDILSLWLSKLIEYDESKARLSALYERKKEFQRTYETFAPLGAKLARIEREIDVYEQQYLALLNSLNQAKLKQQNLEFKSNIKTVDPAYFPLSPEGSTRKLMIIASVIAGLILTLFVILLLEYFDDTIKSPKRAKSLTELDLISAYPKYVKQTKGINYEFIQSRLMEIAILNMRSHLQKLKREYKDGPILVLMFSTSNTDGKTLIQEQLANKLRQVGYNTLSMNYHLPSYQPKFSHEPLKDEDYYTYEMEAGFFNVSDITEIFDEEATFDLKSYDYVLLEIPSIIDHPYPPELIKKMDFGISIVRANRTWKAADMNALQSIKEFMNFEPTVLLNGANPEFLQELIGELPRKRSRLRRVLKKAIKLQFFERYQLKK